MFKVLFTLLFVVFFFIFLTMSFVVVSARTLFEVTGGESSDVARDSTSNSSLEE